GLFLVQIIFHPDCVKVSVVESVAKQNYDVISNWSNDIHKVPSLEEKKKQETNVKILTDIANDVAEVAGDGKKITKTHDKNTKIAGNVDTEINNEYIIKWFASIFKYSAADQMRTEYQMRTPIVGTMRFKYIAPAMGVRIQYSVRIQYAALQVKLKIGTMMNFIGNRSAITQSSAQLNAVELILQKVKYGVILYALVMSLMQFQQRKGTEDFNTLHATMNLLANPYLSRKRRYKKERKRYLIKAVQGLFRAPVQGFDAEDFIVQARITVLFAIINPLL
ncbi:MAG: hypothetical protein EZS28_005544, partial [Streblomastix strix]